MIRPHIENLLTSFSYLVLTRNAAFGLVLLLLSFINPSAGILAIIAYLSSILLGRLIGLGREHMVGGMFTYNSVLVGLSMGYLFKVSVLSVFFTVVASFFTLLLSFALHTLFSYYLRLPILNLPFTITATLVYLSSIRYGSLYVANTMRLSGLNFESLPLWMSGLFKTVGILMFLPYDLVGIVVLGAMLLFSRINFFLILVGYYSGALFLAVLKGSTYAAYTDLYSFNFILIALALGGLFLIPSVKSYVIALSGVLISVFILDAVAILWSSYGIPAFTFPFVIVVPLMLYVLSSNRFALVASTFLGSPERNLEHYTNYASRFKNDLPQPQLPFSGQWQVYQGFDGEWTHRGAWAHAVDFVIADPATGSTFRNEGKNLEDFLCYHKPVLSPVSGRVIDVCSDLGDNPVGMPDKKNNWGNYVIVYSDWGYYVEISHFAHNSITVKPGDYLVQGQFVGTCGNSGNSPEPHIHLQCQYLPHIGAPTVPFGFTNCVIDGTCRFGDTIGLEKGTVVRPVIRSRLLERKMSPALGDKMCFGLYRNGALLRNVTFTVTMADDGTYYIADPEGRASLYYQNRDGVLVFYKFMGSTSSPLRHLFVALPRMPLTDEDVAWCDDIDFGVACPEGKLLSFIKSFNHGLFTARGSYRMQGGVVSGAIELTMLRRKSTIQTTLTMGEKGIERIATGAGGPALELRAITENA